MMKKVGSVFENKFHLLYSQESSEKIIWSTSDSSDYENHKENNEYRKYTPNSRKRKRRCRNKLRNISNLNVVYAEDKQKVQLPINTRKSPIMKMKSTPCTSPIVSKPQRYATKDLQKSPIVSIPQDFKLHKSIKSPILKSKTISLACASGLCSPNVRKKLFACKETPLLHKVKEVLGDKSIPQDTKETSTEILTHNIMSESNLSSKGLANKSYVQNNKPANEKVSSRSADLVKSVKSYFENHFNSQASSQNSISEYESTPRTCTRTSDEIDISLTDNNEKSNSEIMSSKDSSLDLDDTKTLKTLKLKKDGSAYRLNSLLKKQNANICMWQNEKFLANNSKFSIPKGDSTIFRIQNVQLKYGCYLLDAKDVDNISYSIIINILHVNNANLESNALIKLYKPYECLTIDNSNVIVNVLKFECDNIYKAK